MTYLFWLVLTLTLGTTHVGFVVAGNNEVGSVLAEQLGWTAEGTASRWNTAISSTGIAGLITGSFAAGFFVKAGRRKCILWLSILAIVGIVPTLFLNVWAILIGKFIYGFSASVIIVASSLYLQETVPAEKSATFDFTTNFGVILGITILLVVGLGLPTSAEGKMADHTYWRIVVGLPLAFILLQLILWIGVFKLESVKYSFSVKDYEAAKDHLGKIYRASEPVTV